MTRNKGALWREESVMQVMAFSVNGVSMDEDGNGEGQGHVRHAGSLYMLLVQDKSCFSQGSITCDTVVAVY